MNTHPGRKGRSVPAGQTVAVCLLAAGGAADVYLSLAIDGSLSIATLAGAWDVTLGPVRQGRPKRLTIDAAGPDYCGRDGLGLLALAVATAGYGDLFQQPCPAKSCFSIDPGRPAAATPAAPAGVAPGPVLLARAVRVSPPCDGLTFVYQTGPDRYATNYYVNWIAAPSSLLTGGMTGWLAAATPLSVVVAGSSARCFLSREDPSAAGSTVFDRSYAAEVVAAAWDQAYRQLLEGLAGDVRVTATAVAAGPIRSTRITSAWSPPARH